MNTTTRLAALPNERRVDHIDAPDCGPQLASPRIADTRPLRSPVTLCGGLPLTGEGKARVDRARQEAVDILGGRDDRLLVVVGPCSVHDPVAALEYARRLKALADELGRDLRLVMRVYFEKPRTTVGWKGLINDPYLDGSFAVNDGLHIARRLLLDLVALDLPAGCEFLDPLAPQFLSDAVTWAAIGARTTESQIHRGLASGLPMPVGFKNGTGGGIQMAVDAIGAAASPHRFLGVTGEGVATIVTTRGNPDGHVILRGGRGGTNYDQESVVRTADSLRAAALPPHLMIDASHGNSGKDHRRQPHVAREIAAQIAGGTACIVGVMLEGFLVEGRQDLTAGADLVYGQSITDSCMGWEMTVPVLRALAEAVRARRYAIGGSNRDTR